MFVEGVWKQGVIPFKSTALKVSRKWNSLMATTYIPNTTKLAPKFLYTYDLRTVKEQKDNYVWSSPIISRSDMVSKPVYDAAKDYSIIASKGILRRKVLASEAKTAPTLIDDEVPF
jgi:hypothetical protein